MKEYIVKNYKEFLKENKLKNTSENIDLYISAIYYDLLDNLELECREFGIPTELEGIEAQNYIEEQIKNILMKEVY